MPSTSTAPLTFYPAYCFALSPTYSTWARLTVTDVHALRERPGFEGQKLYFHLNHPIKWIRLVGLIVTFDVHPTRFILLLDDSSGSTIEVTYGRKPPPPRPLEDYHTDRSIRVPAAEPEPDTKGFTASGHDIDLQGVDIGSVVKIKGGIGDFRGQRQVLLERISIVATTTEEAAAWAENTAFRREVLDKPWVVDDEEQKRARRKAEGLDHENEIRGKKRRKAVAKGKRRPGNNVHKTGPLSEKNLKRRNDDEQRWKEEKARRRADANVRRRREEDAMRRIEEEDVERQRAEEEAKRIREEQERKREEEVARKRVEQEEREKLATERRRRNEARERVLREMGAGR